MLLLFWPETIADNYRCHSAIDLDRELYEDMRLSSPLLGRKSYESC